MQSAAFPPSSAWSSDPVNRRQEHRAPVLSALPGLSVGPSWVTCTGCSWWGFNTGRCLLFSVQSDEELSVCKRSLGKGKKQNEQVSCWFKLRGCLDKPLGHAEASAPFWVSEVGERDWSPGPSQLRFCGPPSPFPEQQQLRPAAAFSGPGTASRCQVRPGTRSKAEVPLSHCWRSAVGMRLGWPSCSHL